MKNTFKTLGIITVVIIVTLSFASCETMNQMLSGAPADNSAAGEQAQTSQATPSQPARFEPAPNQPSPVGRWSGETTFNANGTGKWNGRDIKWVRIGAGNQLTLTIIGSDVGDYWYSIEGDTLTIVSNPNSPEFGSTYTRQ
jgi:predicted small secreted protein